MTDSPVPAPSPDYVLVQPVTPVGLFDARQPVDKGPEEYAEGTVIRDTHGDIAAYRVASGDIYSFIDDRFGLGGDGYILVINQIRRGDGIAHPQGTLDVDDVVNLSAFTITKFGSVGGAVYNDSPPNPMPPQQ